jgi:hypothetical protein
MKRKQLSKFGQKPSTKIGWWVLFLGLPLLFMGPILGIFAAAIRPLLDKSISEQVGQVAGFVLITALVVDLVTCIVLGIIALKKGERSWAVWLGFIPAILATLFLLFMVIGEFIFPH